RDWTVAWENVWYQIDRRHEGLSLAGKSVVVRRLLDGGEQMIYRGQKLVWRKLPGRPERPPVRPLPSLARRNPRPAAQHPWRGLGGAVGREYWKEAKKRGRAARRAQGGGLRSASATLRPPSVRRLALQQTPGEETVNKGTFSPEL